MGMYSTTTHSRKANKSPILSKILFVFVFLILFTPIVSGKEVHDPISITSDEDFITLGFPGSGTKSDPYRIENIRIEAGSDSEICIDVKNTTAYFEIRSCELVSSYLGISIRDTAPGTVLIESNVIKGTEGDGGGISLGADGILVINNMCTNFVEGLHTNYADDCIIVYNNLSSNRYHGVSLRYSSHNLVAHNLIKGNEGYGVLIIRSSYYNNVYNNTFIDNSMLSTYDWDDIYSFNVVSQGRDERSSNNWYDEVLRIGNKWSDYSGEGEYLIDGEGGAVDQYPSMIVDVKKDGSSEDSQEGINRIPGFSVEVLALGVLIYGLEKGRKNIIKKPV
jgi:parallel beta-helix repeat protein